jgi:hypothetical protein
MIALLPSPSVVSKARFRLGSNDRTWWGRKAQQKDGFLNKIGLSFAIACEPNVPDAQRWEVEEALANLKDQTDQSS